MKRRAILARQNPACIVPGTDCNVGVSELLRHVAELHARSEQLARESVTEVLGSALPDPRSLAEVSEVATAVVRGVGAGKDELLGTWSSSREVPLL